MIDGLLKTRSIGLIGLLLLAGAATAVAAQSNSLPSEPAHEAQLASCKRHRVRHAFRVSARQLATRKR